MKGGNINEDTKPKTKSIRYFLLLFKLIILSIVRFMPNLSIKYGESITAVYSDNLSAKEKKNIEKFSFFGTLIWLKKEEEINFVA